MATIFLADEFLFLEIEGELDQFEPLFEPDYLGLFDLDETEPRPPEPNRWSYRVPCPGVRFYFYE
ncbi:MAG: hypothetical protein J4N69_05635 [Chloroflexi bacterium]|nr:hypothetical protein [Chloroflexota bacterium]MCH9017740.1 hypothetical protein [Chloroflexota bacterium]MCI0788346.1 hypothetical protein [Chloroflexota bacterium]MCI0801557.1 hypothetical protein [Chloroflexota bacterium]MCI0829850.1 hypothetical protein [Chloroflexota bacterium]